MACTFHPVPHCPGCKSCYAAHLEELGSWADALASDQGGATEATGPAYDVDGHVFCEFHLDEQMHNAYEASVHDGEEYDPVLPPLSED